MIPKWISFFGKDHALPERDADSKESQLGSTLEVDVDLVALDGELGPIGRTARRVLGERLRFLVDRAKQRLVTVVVAHELERHVLDAGAPGSDAHQQADPVAVGAAAGGGALG